MLLPLRIDPVGVYRFKVEIGGIQVGGFTEVSGLELEIETEQIYEGGLSNSVHVLPKKVKYKNIVLKKGIANGSELIDWFRDCINGNITRRYGSIILYDSIGEPVKVWSFTSAYPVKCSWSSLNAKGSQEVAIETIELAHESLTIVL